MAHGGLERPRVKSDSHCESRICAQFAGGLRGDEIRHRHWFGGSCARHMAAKATWLRDHLLRVRGFLHVQPNVLPFVCSGRKLLSPAEQSQTGFAAHLGLTIRGQCECVNTRAKNRRIIPNRMTYPPWICRFRDSFDTRKLLCSEGLVPVLLSFTGGT
jgi:hypothetical protein